MIQADSFVYIIIDQPVGETGVSGIFYNPFLVPVHQKYKRVFSDIQPKIYAQGMQPPAGATQ
jgi:hypothetical protein